MDKVQKPGNSEDGYKCSIKTKTVDVIKLNAPKHWKIINVTES
jgi:hypothetical protein